MVKIINNYTLIDQIGEGNYGSVYRAVNSKKQGEFAVKIIPIEKFQENLLLEQCTINEVKTLSKIGPCEYIVKYQDHFQTKNNYYFVYEYCNGGTLMDVIKRQAPLQQKKALLILKQLLEAFKVLNRENIMHRDIKPENIFFANGKIKLGDFGFCKGLKPGQNMAKTMLGSPIYMAPEVLRGQAYTTKADVWSLGVVLYEMLFGHCPFQSNSIAMLIGTINNNDIIIPLQINNVCQKTQILLKKMLTKDYFRRISWIQLFSYKIDEEGVYIESDITKSPFSSSNKSYSTIKDQIQTKPFDSKLDPMKKNSSVPKQQSKMKFYSQKYMNAVMQPIISSKGTEKAITVFQAENLTDKNDRRQDQNSDGKKSEQKRRQNNSDIQVSTEQNKRGKLLKKHFQCIQQMIEGLKRLQKREVQCISESYLTLLKIHEKLKEITGEISIAETDLLDIASLINYEIIQVDRQIIDTKQELTKRKIQIPKTQKTSIKSIQSNGQTITQIKAFQIGAIEGLNQ